jgi:predicted 3-demethylubiquinone-9 3-methyltransferase (glyoxalase superfamily)
VGKFILARINFVDPEWMIEDTETGEISFEKLNNEEVKQFEFDRTVSFCIKAFDKMAGVIFGGGSDEELIQEIENLSKSQMNLSKILSYLKSSSETNQDVSEKIQEWMDEHYGINWQETFYNTIMSSVYGIHVSDGENREKE